MEHQQEPGDIRDESSLSNNPSTYPMNQESENLMASAPSKLLIGNEQTKRRARGPNQMPKHRYTITELMDNGIPCAPLSAAKAWKTACGCIVRDIVPINYRAWKGQRADGLVVKMEDKDLCWAKLREKFTFPPSTEEHARTASLSEMGRLFKSWKCELNKKFVQKGETPDFENPRFTKLKPFWDDFVAWKTSEEAQRISEQNKVNSLKNVEPHRLGPGGYLNKLSKWDQMEQRLIDSGVTPKTSTWTTRSKYYSYARGTVLSEDGNLVSRGPREHEMNQRIAEAHEKTSRGEFVPDRENDELTLALGNKEHPGRTRGVGLVPWRQGFPASAENYKSRRRDKGAETKNTRETITAEPQEVDRQMEARLQEQATQLLVQFQAQLQEHVQEALTQIQAGRASVPAPFRASPSGLRKSISASIEQPVRYPVDEITARTPCNLYMPWKNITKNVAQGVAHPCEAGQMLHGHVLPAGYARVEVKFVKPRHWDAKLDIPPKENIKTLGQALHCVIAWPKRYIDVDDEDLNDGEFAPPQR